MTEAKEVEVQKSFPENAESTNNDPVAEKEIVTGGEKPTEEEEEVLFRHMTEAKEVEVEKSCPENAESTNNDPIAEKEIVTGEEKPTEEKEEELEVFVRHMTEAKEVEVEKSCPENAESTNNDPVTEKEIVTGGEKPTEKKEEVDKKIEEGEGVKDQEEELNDNEAAEGSEGVDDKPGKKLEPSSIDVGNDGRKELHVEVSPESNSDENIDSPVDAVENGRNVQTGSSVSNIHEEDPVVPEASLKIGLVENQESPEDDEEVPTREDAEQDKDVKLNVCDSLHRQSVDDATISGSCAVASPNIQSSPMKVEHMEEELKNEANVKGPMDVESNHSHLLMFDTDTSGAGESGSEEEQAAFIMELVKFHKERGLDFKPPKFYGEPLNLLKLWRSVLQLGGYDKVTACKYWRQVGESFKPPKTCTTVSWTFRIFYEKALVDYERYRASTDGSGLAASLSVSAGAENQAPASGRARRDAAARAMQGWHSQRILDNGEVSDPIIKDKNSLSLSKKEKPLKSLGGILKRKKPSTPDATVTATQMKLPRTQSDATVIDIGSPADWVKINVRATRDCYEVYALVPGLLREEVRVQSDPAGRLVISGEPENPDNPWNVTPFKKVVSLPSRIDPHQTSAVVTLHGQLFVRVPFEQYE